MPKLLIKRIGRPPRDPSSANAPAARGSFHVGLRLNEFREAKIKRLVPVNVTASSLIHAWIIERLEAEIAKSNVASKRKR